ncbi:MAG: GPR endopeptidase [Bacilli bacterium]|nr:GPR endopeptidase [Bacilli bacterium]
MKNRIDLKNFNIRTDLVIDNEIHDSYINKKNISDSIAVTSVDVNDELGTELNKKPGSYITIEFEDITNHEDCEDVIRCLSEEIMKLLSKKKIDKDSSCLVLGLGNRFSTADSLGPITLDKVMVTRHLFLLNTGVKDGIREVSAISPGVMANTGIETYDIITSLIERVKPNFLIAIDALASSSIDRINKTIQITDTGIHPGSGIGNNRKEISIDTVGIPVIAIGVPTVVESSILVSDTIDFIFQHISYIKANYESNKLVVGHRDSKKYLEKLREQNLNENEKKELSGILGTLDEGKKKELIYEVLNSIDYNMIVTPKEIDFLIDKLSGVIASAINKSLHECVTDNFIS